MKFVIGSKYKTRNGITITVDDRFHGFDLRGKIPGHPEINGKYGAHWTLPEGARYGAYEADYARCQQYKTGTGYVFHPDFDLVEKV